jgi:hypothetical protein
MKDFHKPPALEENIQLKQKLFPFFQFCLSGSSFAEPVPESGAFLTSGSGSTEPIEYGSGF